MKKMNNSDIKGSFLRKIMENCVKLKREKMGRVEANLRRGCYARRSLSGLVWRENQTKRRREVFFFWSCDEEREKKKKRIEKEKEVCVSWLSNSITLKL